MHNTERTHLNKHRSSPLLDLLLKLDPCQADLPDDPLSSLDPLSRFFLPTTALSYLTALSGFFSQLPDPLSGLDKFDRHNHMVVTLRTNWQNIFSDVLIRAELIIIIASCINYYYYQLSYLNRLGSSPECNGRK